MLSGYGPPKSKLTVSQLLFCITVGFIGSDRGSLDTTLHSLHSINPIAYSKEPISSS